MNNESLPAHSTESRHLNRRAFVKLVPAATTAALVSAQITTDVLAQATAPSPTPSPSPSPSPAAPSPLAEAYAEVARLRFGKNIEDAQWERIKRDLDGNIRASDRFREFKLKNGDEPDFIFIA